MQTLAAADISLMASVLTDPRVRGDLALEETQAGWLATVLLIGAAVAGPAVGYLADRFRRPRLLAIGFAAWSLAVVATGLARTYDQVQAARAAAGAGGAAATVVVLTLLADIFPRRMRGRVFAAYFLAMPAGAALGLLLASALPPVAGWQAAFLVAGRPGWRWPCSRCSSPIPSAARASRSTKPGSGCTSRSGRVSTTTWT